MKPLIRSASLLAAACLAWSGGATRAEDIDLFAARNPVVAAAPNLLIVLDNSANWNQPLGATTRFAAIRSALAAAVDALTDATGNVNIGLLLFNEAGRGGAAATPPGSGTDGAYVRFAARSMADPAHRAELAALFDGLDAANDQGVAAQPALALEEARRYLGGVAVLHGNTTAGKVDRRALAPGQGGYLSPAAGASCQGNYVLIIGSGPPAASDAAAALPFASALNGGAAPAQLVLPPPYPAPPLAASQDAAGNWTDEYAALLRREPYPPSAPGSAGAPANGILTYAIAVHDPQHGNDNTAAAASGRALLLNAAIQGGGRYFDAADASAVAQAVRAIIAEVQAADTSFAALALPPSLDAPGTYLNQVYMGMFRPDATGSPRWSGNLKQYQFAYDSRTGSLELVDALARQALDAAQGSIAPAAQSFWSTARTSGPILPAGTATVDFFANAPAGTGLTPLQQQQEAPDGGVAAKGGAAQQLRAAYLGDQSARNVLTCPMTGCVPGVPLTGSADHAFDAANLDCARHAAAFGLAGSACIAELPQLIAWVRGADNTSPANEAIPGPGGLGPSPVRASVHGDVLHARPLLVNYGAAGIVAFFGANDGTLRAVQAGQPEHGGGRELWAFVAPETFAKFKRLRDASPALQWPSPSSGIAPAAPALATGSPKDYFFDGPVTHHAVRDAAGNIVRAYLFAAARRGGSFLYAFDVTAPAAPRFLWKHAARDGADSAFDDLAQTFSGARTAIVAGYARPVVIFGGGYHGGYDAAGAPAGEDAHPAGPCRPTAAQGCGNRIFVLDAATGAIVRTFQANAGEGGDLVHGVAADLALVDAQGGGAIDRAYAADTGGNVWRIDFDRRGADRWTMRKFASVGDALNPRKFLFAPDVVVTKRYAAVLIGSGDREKPLKTGGSDRFYMFKDKQTGAAGAGGDPQDSWPIRGDATTAGNMADVVGLTPGALRDVLAAENNAGWFYALAPGEKVVNAPLTAAGAVYFGTNHPVAPAAGSCRANLGTARAYGLLFDAGTPSRDLNGDGVRDASDAAVTLAGGGLPPSPVAGVVGVVDAATGKSAFVPFVIGAGGTTGGASGLPAQGAPAIIDLQLSKARKKTYWNFRSAP
ncbi:MAG: hypothetical protein IPO58_03325 [Betaproteobacteria bacterium]|nr:hypothetical protein [Betaproteobacteria bacterium]